MSKRVPTCHPDRPYFAKGLCKQCYGRNYQMVRPRYQLSEEQRQRGLARKRQWYQENKALKRSRDSAYLVAVKADPVRLWKRQQRTRRTYLNKEYGITPELYDEMLVGQLGLCALCGKQPTKRGLDVDHNHETGEVRGLLCYRCNATVIAIVEDGPLLEKAKIYLALYARRAQMKKAPEQKVPLTTDNETVAVLSEDEPGPDV